MRKMSEMFQSSALRVETRLATDTSLNTDLYRKASIQTIHNMLLKKAEEYRKKGD